MKQKMLPFNLEIMNPSKVPWGIMKPVTSQDIYDGLTTNPHEDGLYSLSIFGRIGSEERDEKFSYINIKVDVFHPEIFRCLTTLKQIYAGIMAGTVYAQWDGEKKDFIKSTPLDGQTGFAFFTRYWKQIEFERTGSLQRDDKIALITKYKNIAMTNKVLVIPAGLREIEVDDAGRTIENEVNSLYRKLLAASNTVFDGGYDDINDNQLYDSARWSIQNRFVDIYKLYNGMLSGKRGILQKKWGSRKVFNSTRNVITAAKLTTSNLHAPDRLSVDNTQMGLYELIRGALPLTIHKLLNHWIPQCFTSGSPYATLINRKTLQPEEVLVDTSIVNKWTSAEGLTGLIAGFVDVSLRNKPIIIDGYYLGLVYTDGSYFKIFGDITELPKHLDSKNVHPLTYTELFYLCNYREWNTLCVLNTRYPITGMGSVYQAVVFAKTTMQTTIKEELDFNWEPLGKDYLALVYPSQDIDAKFYDSLSIHPSRLGLNGGDYDGDQLSSTIILGEDAIAECKQKLLERETFIDGRGTFLVDVTNDTLNFVLKSITSA